ncbi:MAG: hypothetical protein JO142_13925 [Burkholderiales bacterium]|nr:hypothetical protein [Burkholderiales bacterium]
MYSVLVANSRNDFIPGNRNPASLHLPQRLFALIHALIALFGHGRANAKVH